MDRSDRSFIERAVREHSDMVYRIALNIVKSREEAQDIVMETFLALIKQE